MIDLFRRFRPVGFRADAPVLATYFLEKMRALTGIVVPPPFIIPQPVQGNLFDF